MKDYGYCYGVLLRVVIEGEPFNNAVQIILSENEKRLIDPKLKSTVFAVVGSTLRHYYVLKEVITRQYKDISEEHMLLIALGIANKLFAKRFDKVKLNQFIVKETNLAGAPMFIECFQDPKNLIPDDIKYGTRKYYSLRYNIPEWVVDMWAAHGGDLVSKKLYHCLTNRVENIVRINEYVIEPEDFFHKYRDFAPFNNDNLIAQYRKDAPVKKHQCVLEGEALRIPLAYRRMCKYLSFELGKKTAIFSSGTNHILEEFYAHMGPAFKAQYISGHHGHTNEVKDVIQKYGMTDIDLIEKEYENMGEVINEPVHTFFVCPRSSFLLGLYERADHFLRVHKEDIPVIAEREYKTLEEASKFVEPGGELIYFVTTFCNDECRKITKRFIQEHPEYEHIAEKQMFPFDKYQTLLYFSVFKRKDK